MAYGSQLNFIEFIGLTRATSRARNPIGLVWYFVNRCISAQGKVVGQVLRLGEKPRISWLWPSDILKFHRKFLRNSDVFIGGIIKFFGVLVVVVEFDLIVAPFRKSPACGADALPVEFLTLSHERAGCLFYFGFRSLQY